MSDERLTPIQEVSSDTYTRTLDFLYGLHRFGRRPGLERIRDLLQGVGDPHLRLRYVHIGGTNGKGSTAAMVERILREAGYRTGLYTSPHLQSFRERIRCCGTPIPREAVSEGIALLRQVADRRVARGEDHPTYFEFVTALMYWYFEKQGTDIVVQEVGLGGTYDGTNIVPTSLVTMLTTVDLDHTEVLGDTVEVIARDKAGILRPGAPLVMGIDQPGAQQAVVERAGENDAPIYYVHENGRNPWGTGSDVVPVTDIQFSNVRLGPGTTRFDYLGATREPGVFPALECSLEVGLFGHHQALNGAMAITAVRLLDKHGFRVSESMIERGLRNVNWPGRLEKVSEAPRVYLDGAHNGAGAQVLSQALHELRSDGTPVTLVFGVLSDKPWPKMLGLLLPEVDRVVTTVPDNPKAVDPQVTYSWIRDNFDQVAVEHEPDPDRAVDRALEQTPAHGILCIAGSLYLVGRVRGRWCPDDAD